MKTEEKPVDLSSKVENTSINPPFPPHLPIPQGTRLLVRMYKESEQIEGTGLYRPQTRQSDEQEAAIKAQVISMGADAYQETLVSPTSKPYCKVGDWVLIGSFVGNKISVQGESEDYRIIQDKAVIATLPDPKIIARFSHA